MIAGDLPPSSSDTFFKLPAAACTISLPTSVEPVNATLSTSGCAASAAPAVSPKPVMMLTTPGGNTCLGISSASRNAVSGVCSAAFSTMVQPAASAGAIFHAAISSGKFHGMICPTTPTGSRTRVGQIFAGQRQRQRRTGDLGRPTAHVAEHVDRQRQIGDARHRIGLAVVDRFKLGQFLQVALDQIGDAPQHAATLRRADPRPAPFVECAAGSGNRAIDICLVGLRHVGDHAAGGGIVDREGPARHSRHLLAVDQHQRITAKKTGRVPQPRVECDRVHKRPSCLVDRPLANVCCRGSIVVSKHIRRSEASPPAMEERQTMYPNVSLFIDGTWTAAAAGRTLPVVGPATGDSIGTVAHAERADLDRALEAADKGFKPWRKVSAFDRSKVMRKAADLLRERADEIAPLLTMEQGKPLPEAKGEVLAGADVIDWFAEEARRTYGRVIPARAEGIYQLVVKEPVGPVAAFTPWNFPINQVVRKLSCALAAGCSIIVKAPEETPASPAELIRCFRRCRRAGRCDQPGLWRAVGDFRYLIPHPIIRKMSFTGSTAVGKQLAAIAGAHMKRVTMELGGHAPAIVFDDADVDTASRLLAGAKYRNAGQVCVSPTRVLVQERVYDQFVTGFVQHSKAVKVGDGLESGTTMGPMANARRITAMESSSAMQLSTGATVQDWRPPDRQQRQLLRADGLTDVPKDARVMNEEPFGPLAVSRRSARSMRS